MPDTVIELDLSTPWEPPEAHLPRRRSHRWLGAVLALVAVLALMAGGQRPVDLTPVLALDNQVLTAAPGRHRLYVHLRRPQSPAMLEARLVRTGAVLWSVQVELETRIVHADDHGVLLAATRERGGDPGMPPSTLRMLDGATGRELWSRGDTQLAGLSGDAVIVDEHVEPPVPRTMPEPDGTAPMTNPDPGPRTERRYAGLSIRTGARLWSTVIPAATAYTFVYLASPSREATLTELVELDPDGALRLRDLSTGEVRARLRLDRSGTVTDFHLAGERVVVHWAGETGATVHDLAGGRQLWRLPGRPQGPYWYSFSYLSGCGPVLCQADDQGISGINPDTGRTLWRIDGWNNLWHADGRLIISKYLPEPADGAEETPGLVVVDARSGRVEHTFEDWRPSGVLSDGRVMVWTRGRNKVSTLGLLDPGTGGMAVLGRTADWFGAPSCTLGEGFVACTDASGLLVWPAPEGVMI